MSKRGHLLDIVLIPRCYCVCPNSWIGTRQIHRESSRRNSLSVDGSARLGMSWRRKTSFIGCAPSGRRHCHRHRRGHLRWWRWWWPVRIVNGTSCHITLSISGKIFAVVWLSYKCGPSSTAKTISTIYCQLQLFCHLMQLYDYRIQWESQKLHLRILKGIIVENKLPLQYMLQ